MAVSCIKPYNNNLSIHIKQHTYA